MRSKPEVFDYDNFHLHNLVSILREQEAEVEKQLAKIRRDLTAAKKQLAETK